MKKLETIFGVSGTMVLFIVAGLVIVWQIVYAFSFLSIITSDQGFLSAPEWMSWPTRGMQLTTFLAVFAGEIIIAFLWDKIKEPIENQEKDGN